MRPLRTLQAAQEALPTERTDPRDSDELLSAVAPRILDRLHVAHGQADERSAIEAIAQRLGLCHARTETIVGGKSGSSVWQLTSGSRALAIKLVPRHRWQEFVRELATLAHLESNSDHGRMRYASVVDVGVIQVATSEMLWMAQSWCAGAGLGSYVRRLMRQAPGGKERQDALTECEAVLIEVGTAFAEWHGRPVLALQANDRFALRVRRDIREAKEQLKAADSLYGFSYARCSQFLDQLLSHFVGYEIPIGRMHIDPHYGNVRVEKKHDGYEVSIVDLGNAFYATTRGGGCGLPGFDCHLLTRVYADLRAFRGPLLGEGTLDPPESERLCAAYWHGYHKAGGGENTQAQAAFFEALQCCWYLTWFPVAEYLRGRKPLTPDRLRTNLALAFYIQRLRELYAA